MLYRVGLRVAGAALALTLVGGCDADDTAEESRAAETAATTAPTQASPVVVCPEPTNPGPHEYDARLHDELLAMLERDQSGRTGGSDEEGDEARTERLKHILAEYGWPGFDLVGQDGEDAAWAIAQHADLDPEFQECALTHLRKAVAQGQGSPGNLAYLTDRIAVARGEPQTYGTQVRCARNGTPRPSTRLVEPDRIDELRAAADLDPYDEYLAEMREICSQPVG